MHETDSKIIASFDKTLFWVRLSTTVCVIFGVLSFVTGFFLFVKGLSVDIPAKGENPVNIALLRFAEGGLEIFLFFILYNYGRTLENVCKLKKDFLIGPALEYQSKVWRSLAWVATLIMVIAFANSYLNWPTTPFSR
jgi:hypothetical protein